MTHPTFCSVLANRASTLHNSLLLPQDDSMHRTAVIKIFKERPVEYGSN
jgi:hypothetical protein